MFRGIELKRSLTATLISLSTFCLISPAQALVPYVYLPTEEELAKSSIGIGRTAAQLLQMGQPKKAAQLAALAVRLNPNDERLWTVLAEAQLRNNRLKNASQSLIKAKTINPNNAGLWFAEAAIALRAKQSEAAIPLIQRGLQLDSNNPAAYFDLGNAWIMQNKLIQALQSFEKATKLRPRFWEALNNQALVLFELRQYNEAIRRWRKVLRIENNAEPMLALAAALNQKGQQNEALALAKEALSKNPNYVLPLHQEEQLWGFHVRQATANLLREAALASSVERAQANATWQKRQ
ncbi:tetratricopeptide repeat protein [Synechococcus sp. M16CYN]|uniref:tetratricopeptide repeat protein n=1 Tax=Synechococcus sp. M16CYN TaxID=3103139 RepID=UPI003340EACD